MERFMEVEIRDHLLGGKVWHKKGDQRYWHREDGPAFICENGDEEEWYYYNKKYYNPEDMPLNLFLNYCKWEYRKNGGRS